MTPAPLTHIERCRDDASYFASMGGNALIDADRLLVELNHLEFSDIHDTVERSRLYAARDAAVARISQAIEEAE